jgi:hypothetical protein
MPAANPVYPQGGNRILDLLLYFTELESQHRVNNLAAKVNSPAALELREKFLVNAIDAFRKTRDLKLTPAERETRTYLRHELRRTRALQKPTLLKRIIFNRWVNRRINNLIGRKGIFRQHDKMVEAFETKTALSVNAANLQDELRALGFRGQVEEPVKRMMAGNLKEFAFPHVDIHRPDTDFVFHVKKMPGSDAYFLEKFVASHRQTKQEVLRGQPAMPPLVVSLKNDVVFNADEARILAAGQAVNKNPLGTTVWYVTENQFGGIKEIDYDLAGQLGRLPIKEMQTAESASLVKSVAQGKAIAVTLLLSGDESAKATIQLRVDNQKNPYLHITSADGQVIDTNTLTQPAQIYRMESSPVSTFLQGIEAKHEKPTSPDDRTVLPGLDTAAEVHARIQLSKENSAGPYVLRPVRY